MTTTLFSLGCLLFTFHIGVGQILGQTCLSDQCYHLVDTAATSDAGRQWCLDNGGNMASDTDSQVHDLLYQMMQSSGVSSAWIGGRESQYDNWRWQDKSPLGSWTNWLAGEPSSGRDCVILRTDLDLGWQAVDCGFPGAFVCDRGNTVPCDTRHESQQMDVYYNDHCYSVMNAKINQIEAQQLCAIQDGVLTSINGIDVTNAIALGSSNMYLNQSNLISGIWIGLEKSEWRWYNGATLNSSYWEYNSPQGGTECLSLHLVTSEGRTRLVWRNSNCTLEKPYICQYDMYTTSPETTLASTSTQIIVTSQSSETKEAVTSQSSETTEADMSQITDTSMGTNSTRSSGTSVNNQMDDNSEPHTRPARTPTTPCYSSGSAKTSITSSYYSEESITFIEVTSETDQDYFQTESVTNPETTNMAPDIELHPKDISTSATGIDLAVAKTYTTDLVVLIAVLCVTGFILLLVPLITVVRCTRAPPKSRERESGPENMPEVFVITAPPEVPTGPTVNQLQATPYAVSYVTTDSRSSNKSSNRKGASKTNANECDGTTLPTPTPLLKRVSFFDVNSRLYVLNQSVHNGSTESLASLPGYELSRENHGSIDNIKDDATENNSLSTDALPDALPGLQGIDLLFDDESILATPRTFESLNSVLNNDPGITDGETKFITTVIICGEDRFPLPEFDIATTEL